MFHRRALRRAQWMRLGAGRKAAAASAFVFLAAGLTAASTPASALDEQPGQPQAGRTLLPELTTATSNTYLEPDGSRTLESYPTPVNYQTDSGDWAEIDNSLVDAPGPAFAVENAANQYSAQIPSDGSANPVRFSVGDSWVAMKMHGVDGSPVVDGPQASFESVDDADAVNYTATATGLKEDIILTEAPAEPVVYTYTLQASPGLVAKFSPDGTIEFRDAADRAVITIPVGSMFDSAADPAYSADVKYSLAQAGQAWRLTVAPDMSWLKDTARVYPVTVDPTLTVPYPVPDCWVRNDQPTQGVCGSASNYLRVGRSTTGALFRSYLKFNVSGLPSNAVIGSGTVVSLYLDDTQSASSQSADYVLHRAGKAFNSNATWNTSGASGTWTYGGGDPSGPAMGALTMRGDNPGYKDFAGIQSLVQGWVDGTTPNNGLVLKQVGESVNNVLWFYSAGANANKPKLKINYTIPNQPPSAPADIVASPGGAGYTMSEMPTLSASSVDPEGSPVTITFQIQDSTAATIWSASTTAASGGLASVRVPDDLMFGGEDYTVSATASDGTATSSRKSLAVRVDVGAATTPAPLCSGECAPVSAATVLDTSSSSPLQPGESRTISVANALEDAPAVRSVSFDLAVRAWTGIGAVRIYNPDLSKPVASSLTISSSDNPTAGKTITGVVPLSAEASSFVISNDTTGPISATMQITGKYVWFDAAEAELDSAENDPMDVFDEDTPVDDDSMIAGGEVAAGPPGVAEMSALGMSESDAAGQTFADKFCSSPDTDGVCLTPLSQATYESQMNAYVGGLTTAQRATDPVATHTDAYTAAKGDGCGYDTWGVKNRFSVCAKTVFIAIKMTDGRVDGRAWIFIEMQADVDRSSNTVRWNFYLDLTRAEGTLSNGASGTWGLTCSGCVEETTAMTMPWSARWGSEFHGTYLQHPNVPDRTDAYDAVSFPQIRFRIRGGQSELGQWLPDVRCDRARKVIGTGCVFRDIRPTFHMSLKGGAPQTAKHINEAISGIYPSVLSRKVWMTKYNPSRQIAQGKCKAREYVLSCDEYPFATTYQGCYFTVPKGKCSVKDIPLADNKRGGAFLNSFYQKQRVIQGDSFNVRIDP